MNYMRMILIKFKATTVYALNFTRSAQQKNETHDPDSGSCVFSYCAYRQPDTIAGLMPS